MPVTANATSTEVVLDTVQCDCGHSSLVLLATEVAPQFWRSPNVLVCETCRDTNYFSCDDCDEFFHNNSQCAGPEGAIVCSNCMNSYFTCGECNIVMHNDCDEHGEGICNECYRERDNTTLVHDYGYRPRPNFVGTGPHYMGVELEVEVERGSLDDSAKKTLELLGTEFAYLKRDGSINHGFEIVSHPASLAAHRAKWTKFFDERPKGLRSADTDNCGLHIHASRNCLSELTIGKMLAFVNAASNANFVKAVARRESRDYARLDPSKKVSSIKQQSRERYEAINLLPEHTVEFRIFKGTLNKNSFFVALEFVQCLIDFCKPSNHSITDCIGLEAFFKFVARLHRKKPLSDEKIAKLGINREELEKRAGSASNPYPHLAKFCLDFQEKQAEKAAKKNAKEKCTV